jgi:uncharacterized MAPEG superfamily protein
MNELIFWLTAITLFTGILWAPYILNAFFLNGILATMRYPLELQLSDWATRAKKAHTNAVENLIILAPLVLASVILLKDKPNIDFTSLITTLKVYFVARIFHYLFYIFKIPYLRTVCFLIGFFAQVFFAITLFSFS